MSIFSVIGKIGSTIGKTALGAAGAAIGVDGLSKVFDKAPSASATSAIPVASLGAAPTNAAYPSIGAQISGLLGAATGFLSGQTHVQADVHTELGGTADQFANSNSGLPSWLLPVGLGAAALMFLSSSGGKRR